MFLAPCILFFYLINLLIKYLDVVQFFIISIYKHFHLGYFDKREGLRLGTLIPWDRVFFLSNTERGITWCMTPDLQGCNVFDSKFENKEI